MKKKYKNKFVNVFIVMLVASAVYQTAVLWLFNDGILMLDLYHVADNLKALGSENVKEKYAIEPEKVFVSVSDKEFALFYPTDAYSDIMSKSNAVLGLLLEEGTFAGAYDMDFADLISSNVLIYKFPFLVSASEYVKGFTSVDKSDFVENVSQFDCLIVSPNKSIVDSTFLYAVNSERGTVSSYSLKNDENTLRLLKLILDFENSFKTSVNYISTKQNGLHIFDDAAFVPVAENPFNYFPVKKVNPFYDYNGAFNAERLEEKAYMFFNNFSAKKSTMEDGTYVFSDDTSIVKYYPSGILEYFNYEVKEEESQTLASAYSVAREFMTNNKIISTEVFLSNVIINSEGLTFYFDYTVNNMPVILSDNIKNATALSNCVEVVVKGNVVRKFRSYTFDFFIDNKNVVETQIDFLYPLDSVIELNVENELITNVDNIKLGFLVDEFDTLNMQWFANIGEITYVVNTPEIVEQEE